MQDKKLDIAIKVTDAAKARFNLKTNHELDELIGVGKGSVALWRSRDGIPLKRYDFFIEKCNISKEWLQTGKGSMIVQPKPQILEPGIEHHFQDPRLAEIIKLWDHICYQQRDALLAVAKGFAKQPPETSPENEEKVIDLYGKRSV